jgi:hypothetical protein
MTETNGDTRRMKVIFYAHSGNLNLKLNINNKHLNEFQETFQGILFRNF